MSAHFDLGHPWAAEQAVFISSTPRPFPQHVVSQIARKWVVSKVSFQEPQVSTGYVYINLCKTERQNKAILHFMIYVT